MFEYHGMYSGGQGTRLSNWIFNWILQWEDTRVQRLAVDVPVFQEGCSEKCLFSELVMDPE